MLTQFQSHALNAHLATSYPPRPFSSPDRQAWVDVLAAQQTTSEKEWSRGSADALRRSLPAILDEESYGSTPAQDYLILSGAAVYDMVREWGEGGGVVENLGVGW